MAFIFLISLMKVSNHKKDKDQYNPKDFDVCIIGICALTSSSSAMWDI
jgi:hypothetical protein